MYSRYALPVVIGWVLLLSPGDKNYQLAMASKDACVSALQNPLIADKAAYACINTETGEVVQRK